MYNKPKCPKCGRRHYIEGQQDAHFYDTEIIRVTTMVCAECGQTWDFYEDFTVSSTWNNPDYDDLSESEG